MSIKPFKALQYNTEKVKDIKKVFCPPYDVISLEDQIMYYNSSPNNFINICLAKEKSGDDKDNNKFTRAKKCYEDWQKKNILVQDETPAIYFYKQEYKILGEKHTRLGFIALMEHQNEEDSKIFPHENTHSKVVDERFQLWSMLNSNISPIFVCYSDKHKKAEKIFEQHIVKTPPMYDVEDKDKVRHQLWRLDDSDFIKQIQDSVKDQQLFIADGHHRFKVSMQIRREKMQKKKNFTGQEPFNFVMTYFTNMDSKDLQIFPMHRIVKRMPSDLSFLEENFRIDRVPNKADLVILLTKAGKNEHAFGLYTKEGVKLLRLKNKMLIDEYIKEGSAEYKRLDATILKYFVFDRVGIDSTEIMYTKDMKDAIEKVDSGQAQASFIMNAVKISELRAIALNGEKMPPKTTYFYPKVLSGLTVYKLD